MRQGIADGVHVDDEGKVWTAEREGDCGQKKGLKGFGFF